MVNTPIASDAREFLASCRAPVDTELDHLIPRETDEPSARALGYSLECLCGRQTLPARVVARCRADLGASNQRLIRTACALEMIHTYSLIHDDLPSMDDDELRRGRATCHVKFNEATAVLAGDALQALAFQTIAEDAELDAPLRVKLISEITRAAGTPFGRDHRRCSLDLAAESREVTGEGTRTHSPTQDRCLDPRRGAMRRDDRRR